ncbi:MAG: pectinesterase family protein, partial [Ferruginibacter sp.]
SRTNAGSSFITAANTPTGQSYGYVFRNTRFPANTGATNYYLGRPWPSPSEAATAQKTVLIDCKLNANIQPQGWTVWDVNTITANIYYGEFESRYFNNNLVDISQRVPWSYQLNSTEASNYTLVNIFGAWDPCTVYSGLCSSSATEIAVSNFRATKGVSTSSINWNISWPITGIRYQLFRSADNINFAQIDDITSLTDTAINFQSADVIPPAGSIYYYYLLASKAGYASHNTDTVQVSSKPTITTSSALGTFTQGLGSPSAAQVYTVSAVNMIDNLTITPPVEYEVSANAGASWFTNAIPLIIAPVANTISSTSISVRLNAVALGSYSGNITHTSSGADPVNIAVTGNTEVSAPNPSIVLQSWPFTQNNADSAGLRSAAVNASASTFNLMTVSNGLLSPVTNATIPPYSTNFGQATAPTSDGLWGTATGGPGGTLSRKNWQQFVVTASAGNTINLDSVLVNAAFVSTASNTKMGLVFSRNGFTSPADSTEFFAGYGGQPAGTLVPTTSGTFLKSFPIAQQNTGPISPLVYNYRLALTSGAGITLLPGESLSIRIYFACGSSTGGKYITIRDFTAKGTVLTVVPVNLNAFSARKTNTGAGLYWTSTNELNLDHYTIEKSITGYNFYSIGNVVAKNSAGVNDYIFSDVAFIQTSFYRLRMTDMNGKERLSSTIKLNNTKQPAFSIYPNPAAKEIRVSYEKLKEKTLLEIYTINGKKVAQQQLLVGSTQTLLSVQELAAGIYIVKLSGTEETIAELIIKR